MSALTLVHDATALDEDLSTIVAEIHQHLPPALRETLVLGNLSFAQKQMLVCGYTAGINKVQAYLASLLD